MDKQLLPSGWVIARLGEVIGPRTERVHPSDHPDAKFLRMDHIERDSTRILGWLPASSLKSAAVRFYSGDVLYGRLRPYLNKVARPHFDGLASAEFIVFPDTDVIHRSFLKHRLNAADFVRYASNLNEGDRPRVKFGQLTEFRVLIPPRTEQLRIVAKIEALFSELDKGIELLKKANAQIYDFRQTLLRYAFEGKLTEQWRKDNKDDLETPEQMIYHINKERKVHYKQQLEDWQSFVNNDDANRKFGTTSSRPIKPADIAPISDDQRGSLPIIPPSWEWISLRHVGRLVTGTTPSTKDRANYGGTLPFFKPSDLDQGIHVQEAQEYLSQRGQQSARTLPASSTLVTCIGATIGKAGFAVTRCATNQQINAIVPEVGLDPRLVYYQVISPSFRDRIVSGASATTLPILNKSKFGELPFALCSLEEQREIIRLVDESITRIGLIEQEIRATLLQVSALRQSILNMAFSGQLIAQDSSDEPASILLERIRAEREQATTRSSSRKKRQRQAARQRDG